MDLISLRDLSPDSLIQIALDLNLDDVQHICSIDKILNQKLCQNELFWESLFRRDFPRLTEEILPIENRSLTYWRDLYRERNRWDGIFRMENSQKINDKQPKLLLSVRYITDLVVFDRDTFAFVSNGELYFYDSDQLQLIDDYESNIKQVVKIGEKMTVLTCGGKIYITDPKGIKGERTLDFTPKNIKIKLVKFDDGMDIYFMDYENNFYYTSQFFYDLTLLDTPKYEAEISDFSGDSTFNMIKYVLESNGNLYRYYFDDRDLIDENVQKITNNFTIKNSGDVWVNRVLPIMNPETGLLIDKKVKDISKNYYVDIFNDIYRYDEDGVYPIPKSSLMDNIHQIQVRPTFPGENVFLIAEVNSHQEVIYEEIVELIQSPNFQKYEIGKLDGINHEIIVTMNDNSIYTSWVFISQGKIYPPTVVVSYDEISGIFNSPKLKNYHVIETSMGDSELYMELTTGERYLSMVNIINGEINPPFINRNYSILARRKAGYSTE